MTSEPRKFFSQACRDTVVRNTIAILRIVNNPDLYPYSEADILAMSDESLMSLAYRISMVDPTVQDGGGVRITGRFLVANLALAI